MGVWNWREREDEKLLEDILRTCSSDEHKQLLIMDLRPYTAALANKAARGGGYEYEGTMYTIYKRIVLFPTKFLVSKVW